MSVQRTQRFLEAVAASEADELLPNTIDQLAEQSPDRLYAEIPLSTTSFGAGFRRINYSAFANAINGMAWWLHKTLGPSSNFEPLCYMGPNDLRHNIVLLGCVKAGYTALFMSPRFSTAAHINFIKQINCKTMLMPEGHSPVSADVLEQYTQRCHVPSLEELFEQKHAHYDFKKTFEQARKEPLVMLHTSGSTGFPKPIIWTHDWAASFVRERRLEPPPGFASTDRSLLGSSLLCSFPPFHAGHTFVSLFFTVYCGSSIVYLLTGAPPSATTIVDCIKHTVVKSIMIPPPHAEEVARSPEILSFLSDHIDTVFYAGGDISLSAGNAISSHVKLFTTCGSTEQGFWHTLHPSDQWNPDHWKFMRLHPTQNIHFVHHSQDLYEASTSRNKVGGYKQPVFKIFEDMEEYPSGDLFSPSPEDPQLWQFRGRADDLQNFISGEKFYPTAMERHIATHPDVKATLFVGVRRPRGALLVELRDPAIDKNDFIESLWPVVDEANQTVPPTAKIMRELILLTDPEMPMLRTAKGTVERSTTVKLYEKRLDELFEKVGDANGTIGHVIDSKYTTTHTDYHC